MPKTRPRFPKGSRVSHPAYKKADGIVMKVDGVGRVFVEWIGIPPSVPIDGWIYAAQLQPTKA